MSGDARPRLVVYADGPDGPLPDPLAIADLCGWSAGPEGASTELLLGWVVREPPWMASQDVEAPSCRVTTFMVGPGTRAAVGAGRCRAVAWRLSATPALLAGRLRPDVAVVGAHEERGGGWRLARSPGWAGAAARAAERVVVERWPGPAPAGAQPLDTEVVNVFDRVHPPDEPPAPVDDDATLQRIAELAAAQIPDGATIQWGPGAMGAAIVKAILRPVGVRTGLVTTELVDLRDRGLLRGTAVAAYAWGGQELWDLVDARVLQLEGVDRIHDLSAISAVPTMVAFNTALQVGLDGAANVEAVGGRVVAGPGGHPDFAAGASRSPGGLSMVALKSTAGGRSTIVAKPDVVSTPRTDVDMVVTEHGVADLRGLDDRARADRLIAIAAPEHREELQEAIRELT